MDPDRLPSPSDVWARLLRGVADRRSPFRTPGLATVCPDGLPAVRTVVLRAADLVSRRLVFHTDARAAKAAALARHPHAAWLFYDRKAKLQVRASGPTTLAADGPEVEAAWARTSESGRRTYAIEPAPGTPVETGGAHAFTGEARAAFRVGTTVVDQIEWLWLHNAGHRRAELRWDGAAWQAQWVAP